MGFKGRARKDLRDYRKRGRKLGLRSREKGGRDPRLVWKEVVFGNSYGKRIYRSGSHYVSKELKNLRL